MNCRVEAGLIIIAAIIVSVGLWHHYSNTKQCADGLAFGEGANWKCIRSNGQ